MHIRNCLEERIMDLRHTECGRVGDGHHTARIQGDADSSTMFHDSDGGNPTTIQKNDGHIASNCCDAREEGNAIIHSQTRIHCDDDDDDGDGDGDDIRGNGQTMPRDDDVDDEDGGDNVHTMHHSEKGHSLHHGDGVDGHNMFHGTDTDDDDSGHGVGLWIPGYASHGSSLYLGTSSSSHHHHHHHDYADREKFNHFVELEKLYENMSESSYDLSLKDIVDPSYTISGNLKCIIGDDVLESKPREESSNATARRRSGFFGSFDQMVSFDFSLCGLRGKRIMRRRPSLPAPKRLSKDHSASSKPVQGSKKNHEANYSFAKSRVHPTNECSTCSSYTVFFKCRCLACGKMYCSNCAKHYMETVSAGRKCKDACSDRPLSKRIMSRRVASGYCCFYGANDLY